MTNEIIEKKNVPYLEEVSTEQEEDWPIWKSFTVGTIVIAVLAFLAWLVGTVLIWTWVEIVLPNFEFLFDLIVIGIGVPLVIGCLALYFIAVIVYGIYDSLKSPKV